MNIFIFILYIQRHFLIYFFTIATTFYFNSFSAAHNLDTSYLIRPDGIGLFKGSKVTYGEARTLYPNLEVSIEQGAPGALWRKQPSAEGDPYYFVFREKGIELFRAECDCTPDAVVNWRPRYLIETDDRNTIRLHPTAISQKFYTDRGIRVGKKIQDLRRAYPELRNLTAVHPAYSTPGTDYEFVCFDAHLFDASTDSIHTTNFYVRPAPGKKRAGTYRDAEYTLRIDPDATIVGIQPHGGCLLNAIPPD